MSTRESIESIISRDGVLAVREYPSWARTLGRMVNEGILCRLKPGIYASASTAKDFRVRCLALVAKDPDAVITGAAAFALMNLNTKPPQNIEFYSPHKHVPRPGYRRLRAPIPVEKIVTHGPFRVANPTWAALEASAEDDGNLVDTLFRQTRTSFEQLKRCVKEFGKRWGNTQRHFVVSNSRDEPWSPSERQTHVCLRDGGIRGWKTNVPVQCGIYRFYLDIAFSDLKIAIEVDGVAYHSSRDAFEHDRQRQNILVAHGWTVLRVTWAMLQEPEKLQALIRDTIRQRKRQLKRTDHR